MTPLVVLGPPSADEAAGSLGALFGLPPRQPLPTDADVVPKSTNMAAEQHVFVFMIVSPAGNDTQGGEMPPP